VHVTILGGGGFRVPLIARQLAASALPVSRVVLYDTDPGRLSVIARVLDGDPGLAGAGGSRALPVTTSTSLDTALRDADVIFAALRPGGLDGRVRDERAALALGVLGQETVGAGGLASAARTVPAVDAIARRIAELAPGAWVISMTNPAGIVTEVMAATLGRRVIGVCDSPVGLIRRACAAAGVDPGPSLGAVTDRVDADYLGINHLGWLRGLRAGGADLLPALLRDPGRLLLTEEGRLFGTDLPRALGALPNEYLYWYYANREALRDVLAAGRTRGEHVRERQLAFYAGAAGSPETAARRWQAANDERNRSYFAELRTGERAGDRDEADVAAGGYESVAIALASALTGGPAARLILNVPNGDTVPALAPGTVIEVPCRVDADGAVPLTVSAPSAHELGLMSAVRACERDIADAALVASAGAGRGTGRGTGGAAVTAEAAEAAARAGALALRAFAAHPLVGSLTAARSLAAGVLADTGLADTGLADTGLADTGLADTGIADTGIAAATREGTALTTAVPPTAAILPSYPIDIVDYSPGPWLISFSRALPLVKWKSATAVVPGLAAAAARRAEPHAGRPRLTGHDEASPPHGRAVRLPGGSRRRQHHGDLPGPP
jgi:6-phospho-beta-glucosidase